MTPKETTGIDGANKAFLAAAGKMGVQVDSHRIRNRQNDGLDELWAAWWQ